MISDKGQEVYKIVRKVIRAMSCLIRSTDNMHEHQTILLMQNELTHSPSSG